jgi:hypothetical protein
MKRYFAGLWLAVMMLVFVPLVHAQVTAGATASAINYQGSWNVGTEQTQSVPLVYWGAQKGNVFSLGSREIINPGVFNMYGGLGNYQPDISALLKHTTINPDQVNLSFDLAGGIATLQGGTTAPALEGRVNFQVAITPNTSFTGGYAGGGLIGRNRFGVVSAGFAYLFGAPSSTQSVARKNYLRRYALKHAAQ